MSKDKDITVLAPNGRRQTIHCSPDTSILQVLEDVCLKQGFQPSDYDLKHHNHILDLTTTIRFSNLPNKATVEMVEADKKRLESNVTVGLLLEDGLRKTAEFSPNTTLLDLVTSLADSELKSISNPCILYMRQEVIGIPALEKKTLRMLGLIKGRAVLRLLDKAKEPKQANVSAVYSRPIIEEKIIEPTPGPSRHYPSIQNNPTCFHVPKDLKEEANLEISPKLEIMDTSPEINEVKDNSSVTPMSSKSYLKRDPSNVALTEENLERRLNIEEEVIFLGTQKAIAFMQPEEVRDDINDLPDEFYDLTIEEVRKLYQDLQQDRILLENTPLMLTSTRSEMENMNSELKLLMYKNAVVRVQFPDGIILQGVFLPTDSIEKVMNFVKEHLRNPDKPFQIFTTPLKESLDLHMTLLEAKFVPCIYMHFKWVEDDAERTYLKEEIYLKQSSSDAANILASKYRAPCRRKVEQTTGVSSAKQNSATSSKKPKWFKQ